jgi:hypothetical protein
MNISMSSNEATVVTSKTTEAESLRILTENNLILKQNNLVMIEIKEMLRKIVINTS